MIELIAVSIGFMAVIISLYVKRRKSRKHNYRIIGSVKPKGGGDK